MIGRINGHAVSSAKGINDGAERAVSNEERLNMLLQQARQIQTDISPNNWTPTKLACVEIDKLRSETKDLRIERDFYEKNSLKLTRLNSQLTEGNSQLFATMLNLSKENDLLRRPLWVKIVGWFKS